MISIQQKLRNFSTAFSTRNSYPSYVKIVEVGPRDGLQNEKVIYWLKVNVVSIRNICLSEFVDMFRFAIIIAVSSAIFYFWCMWIGCFATGVLESMEKLVWLCVQHFSRSPVVMQSFFFGQLRHIVNVHASSSEHSLLVHLLTSSKEENCTENCKYISVKNRVWYIIFF
jgi:hypothetical protein